MHRFTFELIKQIQKPKIEFTTNQGVNQPHKTMSTESIYRQCNDT